MNQQPVVGAAVNLLGFVGALALVEICLGNSGRRWVQASLEALWIRFDDIKLPKVGLAEAVCCLATFDRLFSDKLLSWRRLWASVTLTGLFDAMYYVSVETYRWAHGMSFRFPFSVAHSNSDLWMTVLCGALSLSITRIVVARSIANFGSGRGSTIYFIIVVLATTALIGVPFYLLANPVLDIAHILSGEVIYYAHHGRFSTVSTHFIIAGSGEEKEVEVSLATEVTASIWIAYYKARFYLSNPLYMKNILF